MRESADVEAPPPGQKPFTGAELLALWKSLPRPDPMWADAVEEVIRSQSSILDEPIAEKG